MVDGTEKMEEALEWSKRRGKDAGMFGVVEEDGGSLGVVKETERMEEVLEWSKGWREWRKLWGSRRDRMGGGSFGVIEGTGRMEEDLEW